MNTQEKSFNYTGLTMDEMIHHLAEFVSHLWQIHVFGEGNTRATAVFLIKYLRTLGFDAANDAFAAHSWYFRNSLVRANYTNLQKGIHETTEFLERFLRNLLLGENNELHNRSMHISDSLTNLKKATIESKKATIESEKATIEQIMELVNSRFPFNAKNKEHIRKMYEAFGEERIFGRTDVQAATGLGSTRAYELITALLGIKLIETVSGYGKGKYKFAEAEF